MDRDPARLSEWLAGPLGRALLAHERTAMAEALECVFGVQCLQVGAWGPAGELLDVARTQQRALLATEAGAAVGVRSCPARLPIRSDSVDVLLLPHTLEFENEPHEMLREAYRVLNGEGRLAILGFEPLGSWAMRHRLASAGFPPGLARLLSERRVADWLKLLGFEVGAPRRFLYAPPIARLQGGRGCAALEKAGRALWPRLSGAYLLMAIKHVRTLTPMRLQFRTAPPVIGGLAEPTRRVGT
ncbi:MAG TPA: methyltransferase domain-containing protein [Gammaproteobacteria bacterium]